jgi:Methyltransferase domain
MEASGLPIRFEDFAADYRNTAEHNDWIHRQFTAAAWADPMLAAHRRHIEEQQLGFGDPAFHRMWDLLLDAAARRFGSVDALEIGVYKGQVISLWALLARRGRVDLRIHAISPLAGQPRPKWNLRSRLRRRLDARLRERIAVGNFYEEADYLQLVSDLFRHCGEDFARVTLHRGLSTDPAVLQALAQAQYQLVYVDGDHTFEGARHDFLHFGPKVVPGGWLVADDAGADLPGTAFWKGYPETTAAAKLIDGLGFRNVLNVGHNRIFERRF